MFASRLAQAIMKSEEWFAKALQYEAKGDSIAADRCLRLAIEAEAKAFD